MKDQFQITIDGREWDTLHARDSFGTKMTANTEIHLGSGRRKSTRGRSSSASFPSVANEPPNGQNLLGDALPEAPKTGKFDPFLDGARTKQPSNYDEFSNFEAVFPESDDFNTADGFSPTATFPPPATQSSATAAFPPPTALLPPEAAKVQLRLYTSAELSRATQNFARDRLIGQGATGEVFRGTTNGNNDDIAVKRLKLPPGANAITRQDLQRRFQAEFDTLAT